jgi:hypothetical protein
MIWALLISISGAWIREMRPAPSAAALVATLARAVEGVDEGRAAVRVPRVVHRVGPEEELKGPHHLGTRPRPTARKTVFRAGT